MCVGSGGQGGPCPTHHPPWIFIHGRYRGLIVLFFGLFLAIFQYFPLAPLEEAFNSAIFQSYLLLFILFFC